MVLSIYSLRQTDKFKMFKVPDKSIFYIYVELSKKQ